jgi:hypothetical protein
MYEPAGVWPDGICLKGAWMKMMRFNVTLSLAYKGIYGLDSACLDKGNGYLATNAHVGY